MSDAPEFDSNSTRFESDEVATKQCFILRAKHGRFGPASADPHLQSQAKEAVDSSRDCRWPASGAERVDDGAGFGTICRAGSALVDAGRVVDGNEVERRSIALVLKSSEVGVD